MAQLHNPNLRSSDSQPRRLPDTQGEESDPASVGGLVDWWSGDDSAWLVSPTGHCHRWHEPAERGERPLLTSSVSNHRKTALDLRCTGWEPSPSDQPRCRVKTLTAANHDSAPAQGDFWRE
jgi:hypothetical protein